MSTPGLTKVAPDVEDEIATDPEETVEDVEKKTAEILALQAEEEKKKQANFCATIYFSIQLQRDIFEIFN